MTETATIDVGSFGAWQIRLTITATGSNYHKVNVRGRMINNGAGRSFNNNAISLSVTGQDTWHGSSTFDISAGGYQDVINRTFTVYHTAAVNVRYRVWLGSTGTTSFGSGGNVATGIDLPGLATAPDAPTTPSITAISNNGFTLDINDNGNNGASITDRQIGTSKSTSSSNATWYTTNSAGAKAFTANPGERWYAWGRVRNSVGWSPISGRRTIDVHDHPSSPSQPSVSSITNNSAYLEFTDGSANGSPITERRLYWNTSNTTDGASYVESDGSTTVTDLPSRSDIYVWSRIANEYGWSGFSPVRSFTTHDVPSPPTKPSISNIFQTEAHAAFTDGAENGAPITARLLYWSRTNTTSDATFVESDGSTDLDGLPPGTLVYIWARTYNKYGWSGYSAVQTFTTVAGAWINKNNTWIAAVPFKRVLGVWKLLEPYVYSNKVWQKGG